MTSAQQPSSEEGSPPGPPEDLVRESRATFVTRGSDRLSPEAIASVTDRSSLPDERAAESFGFHIHKYVTEFIRLADQKAAFVFALSTGLLCYGFTTSLHRMWLKVFQTWSALDLLCFISMLMLALGLLFSCWVIVPSLRKSHRGFVFFGSISEYESASVYASDILGASPAQLCRAVAQHTYDISKVCAFKYWKLSLALWCSFAGVIAFVAVLLMKP